MKLDKYQIIKKYGKSRCRDVQYFLDRLNRNYNFPYSEATLYEMVIDFNSFSDSDFSRAFKILDAIDFYGAVKMSHIKKACKEAKEYRIRQQKIKEKPEQTKGCPMPDHVAKLLTEILPVEFGKNNE